MHWCECYYAVFQWKYGLGSKVWHLESTQNQRVFHYVGNLNNLTASFYCMYYFNIGRHHIIFIYNTKRPTSRVLGLEFAKMSEKSEVWIFWSPSHWNACTHCKLRTVVTTQGGAYEVSIPKHAHEIPIICQNNWVVWAFTSKTFKLVDSFPSLPPCFCLARKWSYNGCCIYESHLWRQMPFGTIQYVEIRDSVIVTNEGFINESPGTKTTLNFNIANSSLFYDSFRKGILPFITIVGWEKKININPYEIE